jgi:hypothetical protein
VDSLFVAARVGEVGVHELEQQQQRMREELVLPARPAALSLPAEPFIPSASGAWEGRKEGYFFGTNSARHGDRGAGYYRDDYGVEMAQKRADDAWQLQCDEMRRQHGADSVDTITEGAATAALEYVYCSIYCSSSFRL